ncbi:uncharacterized protein PHALS_05918 [Plasmopara halstedii]|uniref:Uncharacterized protein n=1 Tax=Plasmopara halstedii TaxID=4781 RepID=A0A0N7L472_PLAHL|nr:uncharacterized protein PHALS_05918 [Plasmopara halstedii]CEG37867.1 hypothetical protein PHALS_05918 [Plasmopara halstedii]|eukprot:XP_024574236.1 hypothetical protein PHALS_05918 [Plasmopara halstedii]
MKVPEVFAAVCAALSVMCSWPLVMTAAVSLWRSPPTTDSAVYFDTPYTS